METVGINQKQERQMFYRALVPSTNFMVRNQHKVQLSLNDHIEKKKNKK